MNKGQRGQLKLLIQSASYLALQELVREITFELGSKTVIGDTQFKYLKNALTRDGKIEGMAKLLEEVERQALKD